MKRAAIPVEGVKLLINDLRLHMEYAPLELRRSVLRRITLFESIHIDTATEDDMPNKVLLLMLSNGEYIVCDEYNPDDYGRVHILPQTRYGHFLKDEMIIEENKASYDVQEIVYEGSDWPEEVGRASYDSVIRYFLGESP